MNNGKYVSLSQLEKKILMSELAKNIPVLRMKIGVSQEQLGSLVGISRQTLSAIETGKRELSWNVCVLLILFFNYNEETHDMIVSSGIFSKRLKDTLSVSLR